MVLLFSSLFSMTAIACCNNDDTDCIYDFSKEYLEEFIGYNPCDPDDMVCIPDFLKEYLEECICDNPCDPDYMGCILDFLKECLEECICDNPCDPDDMCCILDFLEECLEECICDNPCDPDDDEPDDGDDNDGTSPSSGRGGYKSKEEPSVVIPPNKDPVADASKGEPYEGLIDEEITFDGSSSYDPDGEIVEWFWDFGDDGFGTGEIITHNYSDPGVYFVELLVTDDKGETDYYGTIVNINHPNRPPTDPIVNSTISAGIPDTEYIFTVVSTDPDGDDIRYLVNWSDGTYDETDYLPNGKIATLSHTWTSAGIYTVKVSALDDNNASSGTTELDVIIEEDVVETSTLNLAMIILLIIILAGLLVVLVEYIRRRSKKS